MSAHRGKLERGAVRKPVQVPEESQAVLDAVPHDSGLLGQFGGAVSQAADVDADAEVRFLQVREECDQRFFGVEYR